MSEEVSVSVDSWRLLAREAADASHRRRGWLLRRLLAAADVLALLAAFLLTEAVFSGTSAQIGAINTGQEIAIFVATLPLWVFVAKMYGLYDRDEERPVYSTVDDFGRVFHLDVVVASLLRR